MDFEIKVGRPSIPESERAKTFSCRLKPPVHEAIKKNSELRRAASQAEYITNLVNADTEALQEEGLINE